MRVSTSILRAKPQRRSVLTLLPRPRPRRRPLLHAQTSRKSKRRRPWWRWKRNVERLLADDGVEAQVISYRDRSLPHLRAVPDHVVMVLQLCAGGSFLIGVVDDVKRLATDIFPTDQRV